MIPIVTSLPSEIWLGLGWREKTTLFQVEILIDGGYLGSVWVLSRRVICPPLGLESVTFGVAWPFVMGSG